MKVMLITPYLPHSMVGHGGGTAVRDLVKHLAVHHEVLLVTLVRPGELPLIPEVENLGVRVAPLHFPDANTHGPARIRLVSQRLVCGLRSLFSRYPFYVEKYWSRSHSREILALAKDFQPEAIQIEYLQMSLYGRDLRTYLNKNPDLKLRIILNTHELGSVPRARRAARSHSQPTRWWYLREAAQWEHLQAAASTWADRTLCVTEEDRKLFTSLGGKNLLTVPLGMDLKAIKPDRQPQKPALCLFVGSFNHRPNTLAAQLLVQDIWPRVHAKKDQTSLVLAGRGSQEFLDNAGAAHHFQDLNISAVGFVPDLTPLFRRSALFVAPLPEGGGIKIKILEAMARGIPVVTSPVGAEGITSPDDDTIIIQNPDQGFADAIIQALEDPHTAARAIRARKLMEEKFGWEAIAALLTRVYLGEV